MSFRILLRPEAEAELHEAVDWYEARSAGLGSEFLRAVDAALAAIKRNPLAYPVVFGAARRALLRRFPYSVIYTVSGGDILIAACMHGRRDPERWRQRL